MFTLDIHKLLDGKKKAISASGAIVEDYQLWKELYEETGGSPSEFEAFYAGYLIGNNVLLRERILNLRSSNRLIKETFGRTK